MRQGRFLGDVFQMLKGRMPLANFCRREYVVEVRHGGWRELPDHLGKQLAVDHSPYPLDHPVERGKAWQFVGVTAQLLHRHINETLIGSRALAAYGDVDGPSAANNHPWSRKCTARLLRRSDTSSSAHGCAGTRSVRLGGAGSVG